MVRLQNLGMTNDVACHELQGLPLTIDMRHPLKFSLGHRHHGFQMRTGWPLDPKSLSDREEALNNVPVESWSTNSMKIDLNESYYPFLKGMIAEYKIPERFFDPDVVSQIVQGQPTVYAEDEEDNDYIRGIVGDDLEDSVANDFDLSDQTQATEEG
jgi:hypothetical protein